MAYERSLSELANAIRVSFQKAENFTTSGLTMLREASERIEAGEGGTVTFDAWCMTEVKILREDLIARIPAQYQKLLPSFRTSEAFSEPVPEKPRAHRATDGMGSGRRKTPERQTKEAVAAEIGVTVKTVNKHLRLAEPRPVSADELHRAWNSFCDLWRRADAGARAEFESSRQEIAA